MEITEEEGTGRRSKKLGGSVRAISVSFLYVLIGFLGGGGFVEGVWGWGFWVGGGGEIKTTRIS